MKKSLCFFVLAVILILTLTSCITMRRVMEQRSVENTVSMNSLLKYETVSSMKKTFNVRYRFFSGTQKPSDEELIKRVQSLTEKKYGSEAVASDIVFTRIAKDRIDVIGSLTLSSTNMSDTVYRMEVTWNVYVPE